jgi:ABC-type multidrug transport system ATPase subunit
LSTAAQCDQIVVLNEGRIVEVGSHQELLALGGQYASLWAHQVRFEACADCWANRFDVATLMQSNVLGQYGGSHQELLAQGGQ